MDRRNLIRWLASTGAMLVIILDARTAADAAREGIDLCIRTVIPSLFPFMILSGIINASLLGQNIPILRPLGRLCKAPDKSESLILLGFISGYPVGAQLITDAYRQGKLSARSARRMLGFCSNAGPAFLFGMLAPLFQEIGIIWALWGIHILSGLLVGCVLPGNTDETCEVDGCGNITLVQSTQKAVKVMASVCGWVVVFRVVIGFCSRWFLWRLPTEAQVLISGLLELSNGCALLSGIPSGGTRFMIASAILSFGGVCVYMQTLSVTEGLGIGWYFPGKVLQTVFSLMLSGIAQLMLFSAEDRVDISVPIIILTISAAATVQYLITKKKVVAFGRKLLYNNKN